MAYHYSSEKFTAAIISLATSSASIQERILNAYVYNISHVKIDEIPEDSRLKLKTIHEKLTSRDPDNNEEGQNAASARNFSNAEAEQIAQDIFYIFDSIQSANRDQKHEH